MELAFIIFVTVVAYSSYKRGQVYGQSEENILHKCSESARFAMELGIEYGRYLKECEHEAEKNPEKQDEILGEMLMTAAENATKILDHIGKVANT